MPCANACTYKHSGFHGTCNLASSTGSISLPVPEWAQERIALRIQSLNVDFAKSNRYLNVALEVITPTFPRRMRGYVPGDFSFLELLFDGSKVRGFINI